MSRLRKRPAAPPLPTVEVAPPRTKRSSAKSTVSVVAPPLMLYLLCRLVWPFCPRRQLWRCSNRSSVGGGGGLLA
ncbi:MAG: hypothetical protein QM765_16335 [Myxococcales bacterium]